MPTYEFIAADGSRLEEIHRMSKVPAKIRRGGKVYKLAAFSSNPTAISADQVSTTTHGYPRVDFTVPRGDLGAGTNAVGNPIIKSQAHERQIMAKYGMRRD